MLFTHINITNLKKSMGCLLGLEPKPKEPQTFVLPLHHKHHIIFQSGSFISTLQYKDTKNNLEIQVNFYYIFLNSIL